MARFAVPQKRCIRCAVQVPDQAEQCGSCITTPPAFDTTVTAVDYGYPFARLIAQFKFNGALDLSGALADLLSLAVEKNDDAIPDLLLPVPLSAERLKSRGYNQAWELARRLAKRVRCATEPRLLLRLRDSPHQLAVAPGHRSRNVQGVFAVEPALATRLRGRTVAIVDDVMTTGATANELARVVRQAGAARVRIWVLARTPRGAATSA